MAEVTTTTTPSPETSLLGSAEAAKTEAGSGKTEAPAPAGTAGDKLYGGKTAEVVKIEGEKSAEVVAAETKAAEDKVAADKVAADKVEADKKAAEPIVYDLKLPEGVAKDDKALASLTDLLGKNKVPPETAQSLVDMHYAQVKSLTEAAVAANAKLWTDTQADWRSQLTKDPELGGDKKAATTVRLGQALDEFGSKEARDAFDLTGAGNHPAVVRFINKMAAALEEGGPVTVGGPTDKKGQSLGQRLYG